ncbi:MAG: hypothetical protein K2W94_02660 [Alphaproteobacteria bacterium]|nr:hypothetical protein [Alphaproteobacteria bacterium]
MMFFKNFFKVIIFLSSINYAYSMSQEDVKSLITDAKKEYKKTGDLGKVVVINNKVYPLALFSAALGFGDSMRLIMDGSFKFSIVKNDQFYFPTWFLVAAKAGQPTMFAFQKGMIGSGLKNFPGFRLNMSTLAIAYILADIESAEPDKQEKFENVKSELLKLVDWVKGDATRKANKMSGAEKTTALKIAKSFNADALKNIKTDTELQNFVLSYASKISDYIEHEKKYCKGQSVLEPAMKQAANMLQEVSDLKGKLKEYFASE